MNEIEEVYDNHPYPRLCFAQTHPDRLATIGRLVGLNPPEVTRCRVMELGCASGANLIPMAAALPNSEFVGVDLSQNQIATAQADAAALGLSNVTFHHLDIMAISPQWGTFDYIIAHGLFSWVPRPVQDQILAICRDNLSADGIAYVSYNTYPGWYLLQPLREMMLYMVRNEADPSRWTPVARDFVDNLTSQVTDGFPAANQFGTLKGTYGSLLTAYKAFMHQQRGVDERGSTILLHDELATINEPLYFHQFMKRAQAAGLQYVAESEFPTVMPDNLPEPVAGALLEQAADPLDLEQQMDFVRNRTFRQTLLCHADRSVRRSLMPEASLMSSLLMATHASVHGEKVSIFGDAELAVTADDGSRFVTDHPISKAAFLFLMEMRPQAVLFPQLLAIARRAVYGEQMPPPDVVSSDALRLAANLLQAFTYSMKLIELRTWRPPFIVKLTERPVASVLARFQATTGSRVVSQRHERVLLNHLGRYILPFLDGTRNQEALLAQLYTLVDEGVILPEHESETAEEVRARVATELDETLDWMRRAALLVA